MSAAEKNVFFCFNEHPVPVPGSPAIVVECPLLLVTSKIKHSLGKISHCQESQKHLHAQPAGERHQSNTLGVMGTSLFTLEFVVDALCGPAGCASQLTETRPAIAVRLLDLSPVVVDAPDGERFASMEDSKVSFEGRGKALVFDLPNFYLDDASTPIPLWLMALDNRVCGMASASTAVLLASACVDLRTEVLRAVAVGLRGGPSPFRPVTFQLTPVNDAECVLTLGCFVRLYAGDREDSNEACLEPAIIAPGSANASVGVDPFVSTKKSHRAKATSRCRTTETQTEVARSPADLPSETKLETESQVQVVTPQPVFGEKGRAAFFPGEIHVSQSGCPGRGKAEAPEPAVSSGAERAATHVVGNSHRGLQGPSESQGSTRELQQLPSSLPLVSQLLRELCQIRNVTSEDETEDVVSKENSMKRQIHAVTRHT